MADESRSDRARREAPRYSKVDRRIWNDAKFRALSRPAANAQTLWFWLLTTDESTNIPGLIPVGRGAVMDVLGWTQKAFDKCFAEIEAQGMAKADWDARLIWLPKAIRRNPPDNPNVVRSWWKGFDDLPECALLEEAKRSLVSELKGLGNGYAEAFAEAETKTSATSCRRLGGTVTPTVSNTVGGTVTPNGMASGSVNQEQEQEQEKESPIAPKGATDPKPPKPKASAVDPALVAVVVAEWNQTRERCSLEHWPRAGTFRNFTNLAARIAECGGPEPFLEAYRDRLGRMAIGYRKRPESGWAPDLAWTLKPSGWERAMSWSRPKPVAVDTSPTVTEGIDFFNPVGLQR